MYGYPELRLGHVMATTNNGIMMFGGAPTRSVTSALLIEIEMNVTELILTFTRMTWYLFRLTCSLYA